MNFEEIDKSQLDYLVKIANNELAFSNTARKKVLIKNPEHEGMLKYYDAIIAAQELNIKILNTVRGLKNEL